MLKLNKEFLEDFLITGTKILNKCYKDNSSQLSEELLNNQDKINTTIINLVQITVDKAKSLQEDDKKNNIKYISFSILLSGIVIKDYTFSINLLDKSYFVDEDNIFNEWKLPYLDKYVENDLIFAKEELMKKFIGVTDSDMYKLRYNHTLTYMENYEKYLKENIPIIVEKLDITDLKLEDEVDVTCGFFLEYQKNVYIWEVLKP